jgi:hypothetical protein
MNLSKRASQYLDTLKRNEQWTSNKKETIDYLTRNGISHFDEFLRYQINYSGYELTIKNNPGQTFSCQLFSEKQIRKQEELKIEKAGDKWVEVCGNHNTAQFTFFLTNKGELCTLDDEDIPNILHSSFDKFVEEYALRNEIFDWKTNPYYFEVLDPNNLNVFLDKEFKVIEECSDLFSTWWSNEELIAVKGVWLDRPEFYFHVYGKQQQSCDRLIEQIAKVGIIKK